MRILVRTSKTAIWSRRFASFALALLLIVTPLHIFDLIPSDAFVVVLGIGFGFAALAFVFGLAAYIRLWFSGDSGWRPASFGVAFGLICLLPLAYAVYLATTYPSTVDVTTALSNPPELIMARAGASEIDPESILVSYPNLITRFYQIPPQALYDLAGELALEEDWQIINTGPDSNVEGGAAINALRRSVLGWSNEMVLRVSPSPVGALIDLRAASLYPTPHDLGENGRAIEAFLRTLDQRVTAYVQSNQSGSEDDDVHDLFVEGLDDAVSADQ